MSVCESNKEERKRKSEWVKERLAAVRAAPASGEETADHKRHQRRERAASSNASLQEVTCLFCIDSEAAIERRSERKQVRQ